MGSPPPPADADGRRGSHRGIIAPPPFTLSQQQQQQQQEEKEKDFLVHASGLASATHDDVVPREFPRHPVRCMQGAFEESIMDAHDPHTRKTRDTLDAATRRLQLLELDHPDDAYSSRWKQHAGSRYHPLWKLIAQISFGVHLLHQNMAKSEQEVVNILQGHIREVDGFLEDVTADFDLALQDVEERIHLLEMPLEHGHTFDRMLMDRPFRVAIVEGNDIIERIIYRTRKAMKLPLSDVSRGCEATAELAKYLERIGADWTRGSEELLDIMAAMRGNAEGWHRAFRAVETIGAELSARLGRLESTVLEVARRAGEASRRSNAIKKAQLQHQANEHARQLRASRSTPHLAGRGPAFPAMSQRAFASSSASSMHSRHAPARASHVDKPLPSIPALRLIMANAHERSASQPTQPTQPQPIIPDAAATEPSTPDFEVPAGVPYFPGAPGSSSINDIDSSRKSSSSTARPERTPRGYPSQRYSDKPGILAPAVSGTPRLGSFSPETLNAAASTDSLKSFVTATESQSRPPLLRELIAEESAQLMSPDRPNPPFQMNVRDMDESLNGSTKGGSSLVSSESSESPSKEGEGDSAYASGPATPQAVDRPQSPRSPKPSQFGLFPALNGPLPGAHPLKSNRVSGRLSTEVTFQTHKRAVSDETTALPPCPPGAMPLEQERLMKPRKVLAAKPSLVSLKGLFGRKQPQRYVENGGLGGHANYAI